MPYWRDPSYTAEDEAAEEAARIEAHIRDFDSDVDWDDDDERGLRDPDEYEVDRYRRLAGSFTPEAASALIERRGIRPLIDEANAQIAAAFGPKQDEAA